jgi:hypothetical protein
MTDLRKAAEMALEALKKSHPISNSNEDLYAHSEAGSELYNELKKAKALAQPEQEPVAWLVQYKDRHEFVWGAKPEFRGDTVFGLEPLYTAPYTKTDNPDRVLHKEWVGLTDAERFYCNEYPVDDCCSDSILRAEAKLKEKNT